jgi:hypothetical protein
MVQPSSGLVLHDVAELVFGAAIGVAQLALGTPLGRGAPACYRLLNIRVGQAGVCRRSLLIGEAGMRFPARLFTAIALVIGFAGAADAQVLEVGKDRLGGDYATFPARPPPRNAPISARIRPRARRGPGSSRGSRGRWQSAS